MKKSLSSGSRVGRCIRWPAARDKDTRAGQLVSIFSAGVRERTIFSVTGRCIRWPAARAGGWRGLNTWAGMVAGGDSLMDGAAGGDAANEEPQDRGGDEANEEPQDRGALTPVSVERTHVRTRARTHTHTHTHRVWRRR